MTAAVSPILIDTHVWVWMAAGEAGRFKRKTVDLIDAAAQDNRLLLAAISLWEVAMLEAKGRIRLDFPCGDG